MDISDSKEPCPICFEDPQTPIVLPCDHIFCYLCLKTTLKFGNNKCPQCRCCVPDDFMEKAIAAKSTSTFDVKSGVKWMYGGRVGGWWFYENSHNLDIEAAYQKAHRGCIKVSILSTDYIIDFDGNTQTNTANGAIRPIKRVESASFRESKGVAGVKYCNDELVPKYDKVYPQQDEDTFNPHYADSYLHDVDEEELVEEASDDEVTTRAGPFEFVDDPEFKIMFEQYINDQDTEPGSL